MRIYVSSPGERTINIRIPTRLLINRFTASISASIIAKHAPDTQISKEELRQFAKTINQIKRKHRRLMLVDVESKDGEIVQISL